MFSHLPPFPFKMEKRYFFSNVFSFNCHLSKTQNVPNVEKDERHWHLFNGHQLELHPALRAPCTHARLRGGRGGFPASWAEEAVSLSSGRRGGQRGSRGAQPGLAWDPPASQLTPATPRGPGRGWRGWWAPLGRGGRARVGDVARVVRGGGGPSARAGRPWQSGLALVFVPALSSQRLTGLRSEFCPSKGGFQAVPGVPTLCPHTLGKGCCQAWVPESLLPRSSPPEGPGASDTAGSRLA